jgi:hypothetical protein
MIAERNDHSVDVPLRRNPAKGWSRILDGMANELSEAQGSSPGKHACLSERLRRRLLGMTLPPPTFVRDAEAVRTSFVCLALGGTVVSSYVDSAVGAPGAEWLAGSDRMQDNRD